MSLYPEIEPFHQFSLPVDPPHVLYVEQCGNQQGHPVLVLHGGPGGGCSPLLRRFFDPQRWHVVLFDQRGAGRSVPRGCVDANTTADLVSDIEQLRVALGIERWAVFGGSWGATLALHYASLHPQRVTGVVLRGVFLGRDRDMDWLYRGGAARLRPREWETFLAPLEEIERQDPLAAYHARLHDITTEESERVALAAVWAGWEASCATVAPSASVRQGFARESLPLALIETHYFVNRCFLEGAPVLECAKVLRDVPAWLVHGEYDLVCPVDQAWALARAWPGLQLRLAPMGGHSVSEPGVTEQLLESVAALADHLEGVA